VVLGLCASEARPTRAADHRDGPKIIRENPTLGALDLNDLYLFQSPANRNNTVMILTCAPGAGVVSPGVFAPGAFYDFNIVNTSGTEANLVIRTIFSDPNSVGRQFYRTFLMRSSGQAQVLASGLTGRTARVNGGGQITAGIFDDPFFFDSLAFMKFVAAVQAGKGLSDRVAPFLKPSVPNNFFANFNTLAIVIEIPSVRLQSNHKNTRIGAWIRTEINGTQYDRTGLPAINTAANFAQPASGLPSLQDDFNTLTPSQDIALRPVAAERIHLAYGISMDKANAVAALVLPDIMPFNTASKAGFLNGRRLQDDVIDAEFTLLTDGALTSDRVVNDSPFRRGFPYLGPALPRRPGEVIRSAAGAFQMEQQINPSEDNNQP
jgi:hypothetical protein